MEYRTMKKEDVKEIFLLGKPHFASNTEYSWDWSISKIKKYLKKSFGLGIVAIKDDVTNGFVLVERNYSSQKPNVAWITHIWVHYKYRRKKIATVLLKIACEKLKKLGKTDLITDVYANNRASIDFFKSNKFKTKEKWIILSRPIR